MTESDSIFVTFSSAGARTGDPGFYSKLRKELLSVVRDQLVKEARLRDSNPRSPRSDQKIFEGDSNRIDVLFFFSL